MVGFNSTVVLPSVFQPNWFANCVLWLTPELGITIATGVSQWNDQSGSGHNFVQATGGTQPGYSTSGGPTSGPTLTFNGSQFLTYAASLGVSSSPWTVCAVKKYNNGGAEDFTFSMGGFPTSVGFGELPSSVRFINTSAGTMGGGNISTNWEGWTLTNDGATNTWRVNGVAQTVSNNTRQTSSISATNQVGALASGNIFNGNICEIIVWSVVLSAAQITEVEAYLKGKYSVL